MTPGDDRQAVAVVIPVWDDYVRWLPEAVESVLSQGVAEQVLVVDNASAEAVPELAGTTVIHAPQRMSTGAARNLGLEAVTTPLVVFLDVDDVMLPGSLDALVTGIRADPRTSAYCLGLVDGETGRRHRSPRRPARVLARSPTLFALANSSWSLLPTQGATIMPAAVARATGGYADRSQGEDWVLGASLAWRGRVRFGGRPALVYRWRGDSPGRTPARSPLRDNAQAVRDRLRSDPAMPRWVHVGLPALAGLQWVALGVIRPALRASRRLLR